MKRLVSDDAEIILCRCEDGVGSGCRHVAVFVVRVRKTFLGQLKGGA